MKQKVGRVLTVLLLLGCMAGCDVFDTEVEKEQPQIEIDHLKDVVGTDGDNSSGSIFPPPPPPGGGG